MAATPDFDAQEQELITKIKQLKAEMGELQRQYLQAFAPALKKWYEATAREYVTGQSHRTVAIGNKGVKKVKEELKQLLSNTDGNVARILCAPQYWSHMDEAMAGVDSLRYKDQRGNNALFSPVRRLCGMLGHLLVNAGGYNVIASFAKDPPEGELGYTGAFPFPSAAIQALDAYAGKHCNLIAATQQLWAIPRLRQDHAAKTLWEQA